MKRMKITTKASGGVLAELFESCETANEIWKKLPFEGSINTWGEEIYFEIPVKMEVKNGYVCEENNCEVHSTAK